MKKLLFVSLLATATLALADSNVPPDYRPEVARVISQQPNYVTVQRQVCQSGTATHSDQGRDTAVGAGVGAVAGTVIAGRHDKLLGAVVGGVTGAVIGNEVGRDSTTTRPVEVCHMEQETVIQGQIVTFEFHNVRFTHLFGN